MDFISILKEHVVISIWITSAIAFLSSIVAIYKNFSEICGLMRTFKNWIKKILDIRQRYKRKKYNEMVSSAEYLKWQNEILNKLYSAEIEKFQNNNYDYVICNQAGMFKESQNAYLYEAVYFLVDFQGHNYSFPFRERPICSKDDLILCHQKDINHKLNRNEKKYYKLLKSTIHFPNNIGYALEKMSFERKFYFTAKACTYKMNICTSSILEYELYTMYLQTLKKGKKHNILPLTDMSQSQVLEYLPLRKKIHKAVCEEADGIFLNGNGRYALMGVQAMVFCKNKYSDSYDVLRIRRSKDVAVKAGFLQFIPSGGFSALNDSFDYGTQYSEFSVTKAILRELLEECFGEEDFSGRKLQSTEKIYSDEIIKKMIKSENFVFNFIGTTFSLVDLCHELCFIIKIEDEDIISQIKQNEECSNVIQFVSVENIEKEKFWIYDVKIDDYIIKVNDCALLNPTSAALWNMVQLSDTYKNEIANKNDSIRKHIKREI